MDKSSRVLKGEPRSRSVLATQILGVVLMALALLMAVSLVSHSPEDPPNSSRPPELAANLAGWLGAHLAYYLLFAAGYGAYVLTLLVFLWGWNRFRQRPVAGLVGQTAALFTLMVFYCGATGVPSRGRTYAAFRLGGWLGVTLSSGFLVPYLGRIGSYIVLGAASLVVLMLATRIPFGRIPDVVVRAACGVWVLLGRFVKGAGSLWRGCRERLTGARRAVEAPEVQIFPAPPPEADEETPVSPPPAVLPEADPEDEAEEAVAPAWGPDIVSPAIGTSRRRSPVSRSSRSQVAVRASGTDYVLPSLDLLDDPPEYEVGPDREFVLKGAQTLEGSLASFGINGKVVQVNPGPVITCFEVEPPPGVKVNRIVNLSDDLALVMKARSIRIQAPIPGKAAVGVEVPNPRPSIVYLKEILGSDSFRGSASDLMMGLGKTASGEPFCTDLTRMPHLLIAGATGSGKSVCINALISSILFRRSPEEARFIMVDPKMLELSVYDSIPHLLAPVVTDPKKASDALKWAVAEMESRYHTLAEYGVRSIVDFNRKVDRLRDEAETDEAEKEVSKRLPYIVVVIDELADLMMTAPADIEDSLARLAQMARAVGIHLILATQRPSVNVITGTIKANFPSRIAFRVASKVDSRTILDANGAEKLLGQGDMLFMPSGRPDLVRIHGAYISTEETEGLVQWVGSQGVNLEGVDLGVQESGLPIVDLGRDERFDEALRLVVTHQQGSASLLQRRMKVGYARAARLVDELEQAGIVAPPDGTGKPREVLVSEDYLEYLDRGGPDVD